MQPLLTGPSVKHYKLINNSLEGIGIEKDTEFLIDNRQCQYLRGEYKVFSVGITVIETTDILRTALWHFPEIFEEIKDSQLEKKEFTLKDMVEFGRYVAELTSPKTISIDTHVLDNWIQIAHPEDCVNFKK